MRGILVVFLVVSYAVCAPPEFRENSSIMSMHETLSLGRSVQASTLQELSNRSVEERQHMADQLREGFKACQQDTKKFRTVELSACIWYGGVCTAQILCFLSPEFRSSMANPDVRTVWYTAFMSTLLPLSTLLWLYYRVYPDLKEQEQTYKQAYRLLRYSLIMPRQLERVVVYN